MAEVIKYYAIVGVGRTIENPSGLARRRLRADTPIDESLRRDLTWKPDSAIREWEYGDVGSDLVEVSENQAQALIEQFREKWAQQG